MNKPLWFFVLLITGILNLSLSSTSLYANEDTGCLFCHQYPGLVRLQEDKTLKLLHIDPELYRQSTHGELGCSDCHKDVSKIPHVGANKIDCDSSCHQSEKDQELLKQKPLKNFHQGQQSVITHMPDITSCNVCHPIYPHSKQPFTRAWLNMHTGYLICEICHLKKEKYSNISYQWITTNYVEFKGKAFGSYFDADRKHTRTPESSLSRIIPVIKDNGSIQVLVNFKDTEKAREFLASSPVAGSEKMKQAIDYYHRDTGKMDVATVCETCHSQNGLLDFTALGFTEERSNVLINTNINSIISHYNNFYIPHIFE